MASCVSSSPVRSRDAFEGVGHGASCSGFSERGFDRFLEETIARFRDHATDEVALQARLLAASFPWRPQDLAAFVERIHYPLAVRSSSLLKTPSTSVHRRLRNVHAPQTRRSRRATREADRGGQAGLRFTFSRSRRPT